MEESIKRVEKLVHATNSALAQMKYSLIFDDLSEGFELGGGKPRKKESSGPKFFDQEDLRMCQDKFKSEADEMLAKMNKLFGPKEVSNRKHAKALERIKEINKKLTARKSDPPETLQSRQKLLSLINQDLTPASKISGDKPPALKLEKPPSPKEPDKIVLTKSKEELKTKILETQEIVGRGFQTAKELSEKVESISKKTSSESQGKKSESSEILRSRCGKCAERRKMKNIRKDKEVEEVKEDNVRVIEVKDARVPTLCIQRLPSMHIKDGLRLQKVHDLEIPAGDSFKTVNTANVILTHEGIEKEKRQKKIDQIRLNYLFSDEKSNYVECFNCGKLNKTREAKVDPRRIDDVLQMCDFNVFDPRIDEFVERYNMGECLQEKEPTQNISVEQTVVEKSHRKTRKLQEMSENLSKLYTQEADALEDNHLRLDNILQSLFRRLDKSRDVFEECCLLKRRTQGLSITKPVTISMDSTRKRMDKKDVKNRSKSRTQSPEELKPVTSFRSTDTEEPKFLLSVKPIEKFEKRKSDKEQPMALNSSDGGRPLKSNRKPSIIIRSGSRRPKRIFKKYSKTLPKIKIQKTARASSGVKSTETKDKLALSTSSSAASKDSRTPTIVKELQTSVIDNFKPLETFSRKQETEENTLETEKTNHIVSLEGQSSPKAKEFTFMSTFDPSFEKPVSSITQPCDLKQETEKSSYSSSSEILKKQETKPTSPKSEKSEEYESDFEGASEPDVNHKLSTILEVDSEREKKQTTPSQGTTPTELVSSLKQVLSALKDQFTRTETLAEKLTENIQERKDSPKLWPSDSELVINLKSARKDSKETRLFKSPFSLVNSSRNQKSDDLSIGSVSEGGSSIGEIITRRKSDSTISENLGTGRRWSRVSSGRKDAVSFKLGLNNDASFSEGEIPSNILLDSEANSARSVGELASDKTSGSSSSG